MEHETKDQYMVMYSMMDSMLFERLRSRGGRVERDKFSHRESVFVGGENAKVVDARPDNPKEGANPVIFAMAWGFSTRGWKPVLKTLLETGRRTLAIDHPPHGGDLAMSKEQQELVQGLPTEQIRKALNMIKVMEAKQIPHADVIAHSEGGAHTLIAALLRPDMFRHLVLFAPAGLIGKDNLPLLMAATLWDSMTKKQTLEGLPESEAVKKDGVNVPIEMLRHIAPNPLRAAREVYGLSKAQLEHLLRQLKERGVRFAIMNPVDDLVFPGERMSKTISGQMRETERTKVKEGESLTREEWSRDVDNFVQNVADGYIATRGGHSAIAERPEVFIPAAENLLTTLKAKRSIP